jgi:hypothetical protein
MGWTAPVVSTDRFTGYFNPSVLRVMAYERHGDFLDARGGFGMALLSLSESDVFANLAASDFVLMTLSDERPPRVSSPAEQSLAALRPRLLAASEANLQPLGRFRLFGREAVLYARPTTPKAPAKDVQ